MEEQQVGLVVKNDVMWTATYIIIQITNSTAELD